ncbi:MAG: helix-turn-helix domain-containing protein [Lachnospiraceae bacterium]|nr:helix-turn-helix domain-containing protein [Lachnospiraceae bacterium]
MNEPYYTIKEAAEKVGVETHVLRYWEEELKMEIHRNQMGHRYYTEHDVELLCMVRKLKDKGMQLKAIRSYIDKRCAESKNELVPVKTSSGIMSNEEKLAQFQRVMNRILSNAIKENNELIGRSAGEHAADAVVTRIQGMTKEQEERQEERFRKLDQTLREIQLARKEAAATRPIDRRRQQRLKRKGKQQSQECVTEEETKEIAAEKN